MSTAVFQAMTAKMRILLALSCVVFLSLAGVSLAQTAAAPPPPAKVEELIKLLDDPEIKAWITTKGAPPTGCRRTAVPTASDFMVWSNAVRAHLRGIGQAIPAVPAEFLEARSTIMTEINGRRPAAILLLFTAFAALGFGAEFVVRHILSRRAGQWLCPRGSRLRPPPPYHRPLDFRGYRSVSGLCFGQYRCLPRLHLAAAAGHACASHARGPNRLARDYADYRHHARNRPRANKMASRSQARLIPMDDVQAAFWYRRIALFAGIFFTGWVAAGMMTALNFAPNVKSLIVYLLGLGLLAVALEIVWNRPEAARCVPGLPRQGVAAHNLSVRTLAVVGCRHEPGAVGRNIRPYPSSDLENDQHYRQVVFRQS